MNLVTETALNRLGLINLAAIDELKEVEARGLLINRHTDLQMAQKPSVTLLTASIPNLVVSSKTYKTFGAASRTFRKLYSGGKADMVLQLDEGNDDPLEAGIEIIAQPREASVNHVAVGW